MAKILKTKTTNFELFDCINELRKFSNETKSPLFRAVAKKLSASASQKTKVNISKIEKFAKEGEEIIIPGKLLGVGTLTKKVTIIAFNASVEAVEKVKKSGGKFVKLCDFIKTKPKTKPKIFG